MSTIAQGRGLTPVIIALFLVSGCSKNSNHLYSKSFNRLIAPVLTQPMVDEVYKAKTLDLNSKYYFMLGEYLARKKDLRGSLLALERARSLNENEPEIYYSLSGIYLQLGKLEETEALLRKTLELNPEHFSALLDLAQLVKTGGDLGEVQELFTRAAKINPDSDEATLALVVLQISQKNFKKAKDLLNVFIKNKPDSHLGYFYFATLAQDQGNFIEAEKNFRKSLELRPEFTRSSVYLGQMLETLNRSQEALLVYEQAAQYSQGHSFYKKIGEMYLMQNKPNEAKQAFQNLLEFDKDNVEVMLRLAFLHLEQKNLQDAEDLFRQIIKVKPDFTSAYYFLAIMLEEKKSLDDALVLLKKVLPDSTVSLDAVKTASRIYRKQKSYSKGVAYFESVLSDLEKFPKANHQELISEAIQFYINAKDLNKAFSVAQAGLEQFPFSEEITYAKAFAHEENGEALVGARELEILITKKKSTNPAVLNFVGYVYADQGVELDKAEKYVRLAQKLRPSDPFIADSLGWVYYKKGDYKNAEKWLRLALQSAPNEAVILEHLADCLVKKGSLQEANDLYAQALKVGHSKQIDQAKLQQKMGDLQSQVELLCQNDLKARSRDVCSIVFDSRAPASPTR